MGRRQYDAYPDKGKGSGLELKVEGKVEWCEGSVDEAVASVI